MSSERAAGTESRLGNENTSEATRRLGQKVRAEMPDGTQTYSKEAEDSHQTPKNFTFESSEKFLLSLSHPSELPEEAAWNRQPGQNGPVW